MIIFDDYALYINMTKEQAENLPLRFSNKILHLGGDTSPSWQDIVLSGTGSLTLTNAKQDGLNYIKLYGQCEQRNLPSGYTQYEYLRSSGTQYIDLGYKGNGNTKVEVKFKYYQTSSASGSGRIFGSRQTSSSNAFAIGSSSGVVSSTGNKVFWCYDGQSFYVVEDVPFGLDEWQTVVFSATEHTINGTTEGDDYTVTTFETPSNLMLFAFDNNGTIGCGYVDIAYCKLWDNGVLVRDLIPAKYGTTYGMYDKVNNTLLTNDGTGDFTVGTATVPTPDYPMDIVCNNGVIKYSKNLANMIEDNITLGYYISGTGVVTSSQQNFIYNKYIPVKPNTTYTLSMSSAVYYITISEYSTASDSGFIQRNAGGTGGNTSLTITTQSTTNYIRFGSNVNGGGTTLTLEQVLAINWMLTQTDTPQTYIPYGLYIDGTTETVKDSLNNTATATDLYAVGTYKDVQSVLDGAVTRNVGVKVLDGTEEIYYIATNIIRVVLPDGLPQDSLDGLCTHYKFYKSSSTPASDKNFAIYKATYNGVARCVMGLRDSSITSVADFKTFVETQYANGTPVIVVYPLATATTESVTGQTLTTQSGTNIIEITQASINNLGLEVSYKGTV